MQANELWSLFERKQNNPQAITVGEAFPYGLVPQLPVVGQQAHYIMFLSMYCSICMNLLPELVRISPRIAERFTLCISGTPEEINEIREHFDFKFPVVSLRTKDLEDKYRVLMTPFLYAISAEGMILGTGTSDVYEEFIAFVDSMEG